MTWNTKKYAIENINGQWWTGSCWGVKQARKEYYDLRHMPPALPEDNSNNAETGKVTDYDLDDESLDVRYGHDVNFARVRVVI